MPKDTIPASPLTKREAFAAAAIPIAYQSLTDYSRQQLHMDSGHGIDARDRLAEICFFIADAMMHARTNSVDGQ